MVKLINNTCLKKYNIYFYKFGNPCPNVVFGNNFVYWPPQLDDHYPDTVYVLGLCV